MLYLKNVDILLITEVKLDNTFPFGQFYVERFNMPFNMPCRLDSYDIYDIYTYIYIYDIYIYIYIYIYI